MPSWLLVVKGNYQSVEKIFLFACVLYITYVISGFLVKPDWKEAAIYSVKPVLLLERRPARAVVRALHDPAGKAGLRARGERVEAHRPRRREAVLGASAPARRSKLESSSDSLPAEPDAALALASPVWS